MKFNILSFICMSFFSLLNSFWLHEVSIAEGLVFFAIATFSAAVIFLYPSDVATLLKVFFIFTYIFFGIVPVVELDYERIYWGGAQFSSGAYFYAATIVVGLSIITFLSYVFFNKVKIGYDKDSLPVRDINLGSGQKIVLLLTSFACFFVVLEFNNYSVFALILRGGDLVERSYFESSSANLISNSMLRFVPLSTAIIVMYKVRGANLFKLVILAIGVICAFPTGLARLQVPTYYFPLLFFLFPSMLKGNRLVFLLIFGFLFVFPFLDNFRNFYDGRSITFSISYEFLLGGHLDAFQNFARIIDVDFVTYGVQALGVILFFVPRNLWLDKPVGTGHELAEHLNYSFGNISATWYAEGWANFGVVGAAFSAVLIGFIMAKLDKIFWLKKPGEFLRLFYLFLLGYMFFLLRGDLLSASSYLIGVAVSILIPYVIVRFTMKG